MKHTVRVDIEQSVIDELDRIALDYRSQNLDRRAGIGTIVALLVERIMGSDPDKVRAIIGLDESAQEHSPKGQPPFAKPGSQGKKQAA